MEKVGAYTERATAEGEWRPGNPGTGQQATPMLSSWFNMLQRELVGIVESAGLALDQANDAQLLEALTRLSARKVTTITAADSPKALTVAEAGLVLIDATSGAVSITLPSAVSNPGVSYRIVRTDSANANTVTITPDDTDTIEAGESLSIVVSDSRNLESDGDSDWKRSEQVASESLLGMIKVAAQALVDAGEDDTTAVTPKKLSQSLDASALGRDQIWQNVSASRAGGVTYTNTTGRPIFISMFVYSNKTLHISVDGIIVSRSRTDIGDSSTAATDSTSCAIVPNGSTYTASITPSSWLELR